MSDGDLKYFFGDAFDPADHEPTTDFAVLSPGKYPVEIEAAEVKETKAGNGHYIKVTLCVLDGEYKNRKLWDYINIDNPSGECVTISMRQLSVLCQAVGLVAIRDTAELVSKTCFAHVKVKDDQNSIRTYSGLPPAQSQPAQSKPAQAAPVEQIGPAQQMQTTQMQPAQTQPAQTAQKTAKPPWARS